MALPQAADQSQRRPGAESAIDESRLHLGSSAKKTYTAADDPKNLIGVDNKLHEVVALYQTGQFESDRQGSADTRARPDIKVAEEMLAFMLQQNEKPDQAIETLRRSVAVRQRHGSDARTTRITAQRNGKAKEAVQILEPFAGQRRSGRPECLRIALADSGDLAEARQQFDGSCRSTRPTPAPTRTSASSLFAPETSPGP